MNDMNDEFVEELLAQCVKLQRMGRALPSGRNSVNHEILAILRQFESQMSEEAPDERVGDEEEEQT